MKKLVVLTIVTLAFSGFVLPRLTQAQALAVLNPPLQIQAKKKASKHKSAGNNTKFSPGSQETTK